MNASGSFRSLLLVLVVGAACSDEGAAPRVLAGDPAVETDDPVSDELYTCSSTIDCPVGHECKGGLCQPMADMTSSPLCTTDADCPSGQVCAQEVGQCVEDSTLGFDPSTSANTFPDHGAELQCAEGEVRTCGYSKVGICQWGVERCTSGNTWSGLCEDAVYPNSADLCDYRDDDCDGLVDEDYDLLTDVNNCGSCGHACSFPHAAASCVNGGCVMGGCEANWYDLDGKTDNGCEYPCVYTGAEICDGADNDCDGGIDGVSRACYGGPSGTEKVGVCHGGSQSCSMGVWSACGGQVLPEAEACNGADDDCDGTVDGVVEACYGGPNGTSGVGMCAPGSRVCTDGAWSDCRGDVTPQAEACNADDDDCDGVIDGLVDTCYTGPVGTKDVGLCRGGTQVCAGGGWGNCTGQQLPGTETCNNADDNCDGTIDQISASCYTGPAGTENEGECKAGTRTCGDGAWGSCSGEVVPKTETCNRKDDDCDGNVDGISAVCYTGPDGTAGLGICRPGTQQCTFGSWGSCMGQVTPQPEACDGIDNDCNGTVDDGCQCVNGTTRSCYAGPAGTAGKGICQAGTQLCASGAWGACENQVLPQTESCDGVDNDCDGTIDGLAQSCYDGPGGTAGVGVCRTGTMTCTGGSWGSCQGQVVPGAETCDGVDNDCNGIADQISRTCYSGPNGTAGKGLCKAGTQVCSASTWGSCVGEVLPAPEACDGQDNDCDNVVDQISESCYTGPAGTQNKGECKAGSRTCSGGAWGVCAGQVTPVSESCNNKDDNCDGTKDEALAQVCYGGPAGTAGVGDCRSGTASCVSGLWGACAGEVQPAAEACDGRDNNCDGTPDGIVQSCYSGPVGTAGVGECKAGSQTCTTGTWSACSGQVTPVAESCNNRDDNCDGTKDQIAQPCWTGTAATRSVGECKDGAQTCTNGNWGTCAGEVKPIAEICDNKDNDCDNSKDETLTQACYGGPAGTNGVGECKAGSQTCSTGSWGTCTGEVRPVAEDCDNKDNDCDGTKDESLTKSCYTGPNGTEGVGECKGGAQTCSAGTWGSCAGQVVPSSEICDGKNNDCDAAGADEGFDGDADNYTVCGGDCNDADPTIHPGATEVCNAVDDDCDGVVDDGLVTPVANAGADRTTAPLTNVSLTGSASGGSGFTYQWTIQSQPNGSNATLTNSTKANATLTNLDTAGDIVVCLTVTNSTGCPSVPDCMIVHVVPNEDIHVELYFDTKDIDMDLHYVAPGVANNFNVPECGADAEMATSFCNKSGEWGGNPAWTQDGIGAANDPSLDRDVLRGPGTENLNQTQPFNGTYPVKVHYYCDCGDFQGPAQCQQRVGKKSARVRVYIGGILKNEWTKIIDYNDVWYVCDLVVNNGSVSIQSKGSVSNGARGCFG